MLTLIPEPIRVLDEMSGTMGLFAQLLYGTGMRLKDGPGLRVKDIDFERRGVIVRQGKGGKDRVTMPPETLVTPLQEYPRTGESMKSYSVQVEVFNQLA